MNYFEYFSEIEERFVARRGSLLLLSTLDWALIETWRDAGVPLAAVLRGIDQAFDKYEQRKARAKGWVAKINGLAWCAQAVMEAAAEMADASVGGRAANDPEKVNETGFETARVQRFLTANARCLQEIADRAPGAAELMRATSERLTALGEEVREGQHPALDELDRTLTALEDRLRAGLMAGLPEAELMTLQETAARELAPYRGKLAALQMRQVRDQFVHKKLFEQYGVPRLSLFYMQMGEDSTAGPGNESPGA